MASPLAYRVLYFGSRFVLLFSGVRVCADLFSKVTGRGMLSRKKPSSAQVVLMLQL